MKKLLTFAAVAALAVAAQATSIGWGAANIAAYNGDKYQFFVIGQNGVTDIATVTALLDAGTSVDSYAFGSGTVANGRINQAATTSGKSLDGGSYTTFFVLYDAATPTVGSTKYMVVSGVGTLTSSFAASAGTYTFAAQNIASYVDGTGTPHGSWQTYGVPEPTTVALLALGLAAVGLKRKVA